MMVVHNTDNSLIRNILLCSNDATQGLFCFEGSYIGTDCHYYADLDHMMSYKSGHNLSEP